VFEQRSFIDINEVGQPTTELAVEQHYVAMLYSALDHYRDKIREQLTDIRAASATGTHQWKTEREALAYNLERRLAGISIGDAPLCFGRIDLEDESVLHIGRVAISGDDQEALLVDWRAPIAALFYRATSGAPEGVRMRRHLLAKGRDVIDIDDEIFDRELLEHSDPAMLHGDAALLAAVGRARTTQMGDIVATIQREQDAVIRSELSGILVVQGGPGTGKTAVALHRAAYLLYAHRNRLIQNGVLVVGPNRVFLHYIEQVLPSLGETGAMLATPHGLYPGVRATRHDELTAARIKGDLVMVEIIKKAIADRQRVPREDQVLAFERMRLRLPRAVARRARDIGRSRKRTHNQCRIAVESALTEYLLAQVVRAMTELGEQAPPQDEIRTIRRAIAQSHDFRVAMERIWPILTPEQLLNDLFGIPALLVSAAHELNDDEREALARTRTENAVGIDWTIEDVAILDEAAELLGPADDAKRRRDERRKMMDRKEEAAYAQQVLGTFHVDLDIDADLLADRFAGKGPEDLAALAATDRTWKFGHVIVDEAQELSPMTWRMIFRRNPTRSMTIVGDLAQASSPWAPPSWGSVLDPYGEDGWRQVELTVNYRTPREIMELAAPVLHAGSPGMVAPGAIRDAGYLPVAYESTSDQLGVSTFRAVAHELQNLDEGRLCVLAPGALIDEIRATLAGLLPIWFASGTRTDDARVVLLDVRDAKGLEFDVVVLVEPEMMIESSPRGLSDLYVALTRATQRLVMVHAKGLPEIFLPKSYERRDLPLH